MQASRLIDLMIISNLKKQSCFQTVSGLKQWCPRNTFQAADPPAIGPPLAPPVVPILIDHAAMALTKVIGRIQNPADPNYPTIMGLGGGSYICTIHIQRANVGQTIHVFKN